MLERLLAEIRNNGTLQPAALAARLNISRGLVLVMLEDLERMGVLTRINTGCAEPCGGCPVADSCAPHGQAQGRIWMLRN